MRNYVLDDNDRPVLEPDLIRFGRWFEETSRNGRRIVERTELPGDVVVSTVFLGLDHNFVPWGDPVLWETMIFNGSHDQYQQRYTSREDALQGHEAAVQMATQEGV